VGVGQPLDGGPAQDADDGRDPQVRRRRNHALRIFFGRTPLDVATRDYESRLASWRQWQPLAAEAYGR
jgi:hypothetical protein